MLKTALAKKAFTDLAIELLLIIGGLNWGLLGLFSFDLVSYFFGFGTAIARFVYVLIGVAAVLYFINNNPFNENLYSSSHYKPQTPYSTSTSAQ
jgi:uncharacterized membrane protein YuzA (DUF378 family)